MSASGARWLHGGHARSATSSTGALPLGGFIVVVILAAVLGAISDALGSLVALLGYLAVLAAVFYYHGYQQGETGQTPGKRVMGIKLIRKKTATSSAAGWGSHGCSFTSSTASSATWAGCGPCGTPRRQTWTDKIMSTHVIEVPKGEIMPIFPDGKPF